MQPTPPDRSRSGGDLVGRFLAWWVRGIHRRCGTVLLGTAVLTVWLGVYASDHLGVDTDTTGMFAEDLPFRRNQEAFKASFPQFTNVLLVVVDGPDAMRTADAAGALAARLRDEPGLFRSVYLPSGEPFFRQNGLLFLETGELEALVTQLAPMAPWLAFLQGDPGLAAFSSALSTAVALRGANLPPQFATLLEGLEAAVQAAGAGGEVHFPWSEAFLGPSGPTASRRHVILVQPVLDFRSFVPAEAAIARVRELTGELELTPRKGFRVRLTGEVALAHEELLESRDGAILAGVLSLILVSILLVRGLRSKRLVLSSLVTLLVGLVWTAGFAAVTVGHLNLISIAFAVLYISLGVAFAIHYGLRFAELIVDGESWGHALEEAARGVGSSLFVAATTTAAGFLAFVPTDFRGVAELGIIAGGGVMISLFANLTVLPALLCTPLLRPHFALADPHSAQRRDRPIGAPGSSAYGPLARHARPIEIGAIVLGVAALVTLGWVRFDSNPIHLRNPDSESVQTFEDLAGSTRTTPYRLNATAADAAEAARITRAMDGLEPVHSTITLDSFVPRHQEAKLALLARLARALPPAVDSHPARDLDEAEATQALGNLADALVDLSSRGQGLATERGARVAESLRGFLAGLERLDPPGRRRVLANLRRGLLGDLPHALSRLREVTSVGPVRASDLPDSLRSRWMTPDGRMRIEIVPSGEMGDMQELRRFVSAVHEVQPEVAGGPMVIAATGEIAVGSFRLAFAYALSAIALLVLLLLRRITDVILLMALLLLSGAVTAATTVLLGLDFNFANVIALPLILGMGVDSGVHMIHRWRSTSVPGGNILSTSTARAVLFSSLTTLAGFGTLTVSPHPGMASVGLMLTIGIGVTLVCTMVVLTAMMQPR